MVHSSVRSPCPGQSAGGAEPLPGPERGGAYVVVTPARFPSTC